MMDKLRTAPLPLKKKLLLTALVGAAFFFVGLATIFFSRDTITVLLSGILHRARLQSSGTLSPYYHRPLYRH